MAFSLPPIPWNKLFFSFSLFSTDLIQELPIFHKSILKSINYLKKIELRGFLWGYGRGDSVYLGDLVCLVYLVRRYLIRPEIIRFGGWWGQVLYFDIYHTDKKNKTLDSHFHGNDIRGQAKELWE